METGQATYCCRSRQGPADAELSAVVAVRPGGRKAGAGGCCGAVEAGGGGDTPKCDLRSPSMSTSAPSARIQFRRRRQPDRCQARRAPPPRRRDGPLAGVTGRRLCRPARAEQRERGAAGVAPTMRRPPLPARGAADESSAPSARGQGHRPSDAGPRPKRDPNRPVTAELRRQGDNLRLVFPFAAPTPAAVFQRADTLWLVFDTTAKLDVGVLGNDPSRTIRSATVDARGRGAGRAPQARTAAARQRRAAGRPAGRSRSATRCRARPSRSSVARNIVGPGRTSVTIPFDDPRQVHWLNDPDIGDTLLVVTGLGPARGLIKTQDFVEFRALASAHGVVIQPFADDLKAELSADKVLLGRPGGLTLSDARGAAGSEQRPRGDLRHRSSGASTARPNSRAAVRADPRRGRGAAGQALRGRLDLARFYLAREMFAEAKAVLDVAIADERPTAEDPTRWCCARSPTSCSTASSRRSRISPIRWSATSTTRSCGARCAYVRQGKWAEAREGFRKVDGAMGALPVELQRHRAQGSAARRDRGRRFRRRRATAQRFRDDRRAARARAAGLGADRAHRRGPRPQREALAAYRYAAASPDRPAAAQGRLREIVLRYELGETKQGGDHQRPRNPHHRLARRRNRDRGAADCWRSSTPRRAATATRSTSCARR